MTPLGQRIAARIAQTGPVTIADYMAECLLDPTHGYYATRDPLGAAGDFTTAPEISQMFGELLGLALAQAWLDRGAPAPFLLVEPGPGRGTLMTDMLRATRGVPGFHDAARVHLIEASPTLREIQKKTLAHSVTHLDTIAGLPEGPLFLIANEFFDALPIRQFQRAGGGWRERVIGLHRDRLAFGLAGPSAPPDLAHRLNDTQDGDIVETCPQGTAIASTIGQRIAEQGGAAIVIDYGGWRSKGDTFQAMKDHAHTDPLAEPGQADLTAHVDFEALAHAAHPAVASAMIPQGVLLERLGINTRAQQLAERLSGEKLDAHIAAHRRLTHAQEMGTLFKAMALFQQDTPTPPGFEP